MTAFTPTQVQSIEITDRDLIVSAGAGAGKTAVLVERIYRLLANPDDPCRIEEMLIVTFSRMAAAEMRERLAKRLRDALEKEPLTAAVREHLEEQAYRLPQAPIATIHSFCYTLLLAYPSAAGLAPGFEFMGEEEARLFRRQFYEEKVEAALGKPGPARDLLLRLIDEGDPMSVTETILRHLLPIHEFLSSLADPYDFLRRTQHLYDVESPQSEVALQQLADRGLRAALVRVMLDVTRCLAFAEKELQPCLSEQHGFIRSIHREVGTALGKSLSQDDLTDLVEALALPRQKPKKGELSERETAFCEARKCLMDSLKAARNELPRYTLEALRQSAAEGGPIVLGFLRDIAMPWHEELFQQHLELRRLTFSHLERLALRILRTTDATPSSIAAVYREKFRHILVDEFQDVNEVQETILRSLCRTATTDTAGNFFCVGDVKQSIYEFRLADPTIFLRLYAGSHPPADDKERRGSRIDLANNFRSFPALLQEFNALFRILMQRETVELDYTQGHEFVAGRDGDRFPHRAKRFSVTILPKENGTEEQDGAEETEDLSAETLAVADAIARLGPPWRDICVLLRSTVGTAADLMEALQRRGVPAFTEARLGFLTAVEVLEALAILRCISNPYDDMALLATLRGPAARWSEDDLLRLRMVNRYNAFTDNLREVAESQDHPLAERTRSFRERLARWQTLSVSAPMGELLSVIFDELHMIEGAAVRPAGDQRRLNLLQLLDRAREFDDFLNRGLTAFLLYLDDLVANGEDFAPPSPLPDNADVVRVMTIHQSKGMQFPVVVVPFMGRQFNENNLRRPFLVDRRLGMATRYTMRAQGEGAEDSEPVLYELFRQARRERERAEELRLLYVALTRAQEAVYTFATVAEPAEKLREAQARAASPLPDPIEILSARTPASWLFLFLARRFPQWEDRAGWLAAEDGIASADVYTSLATLMAPGAAAATQPAGDEPPQIVAAEVLSAIQDGCARMDALAAMEQPERVRAKISVTEAKRAFESARDAETPPLRPFPARGHGRNPRWWFPQQPEGVPRPDGAERGRAMHRFLALFDMADVSRGNRSLRAEMQRLVDSRLLTEREAALVDLPAVQWFLNSDLGRSVRSGLASLERERAFLVSIDSRELSPNANPGPVLLQGVLDVLYRGSNGGWIVLDYKTDDCGAKNERLETLVDAYRPQVELYRLMVERTLGEPVEGAWLVFMNGRTAVPVEQRPGGIDRGWTEILQAGVVVPAGGTGRRVREPRGL